MKSRISKPKFPEGILLDIGCRDRKEPNFTGINWKKYPTVDIVHNLEVFPYPLKSSSCLTIKAAHVVEHIKPWLVFEWFDEMWRLLLPDGQLAVSAPYPGSRGFYNDPTHCSFITEATWQHLDPDFPLYKLYEPKPWKIEYSIWRPDGNIEAILRKRSIQQIDKYMELTQKALSMGAMQKPTELYSLLNFIKDKPLKTVLEIGTARGGVFYCLCKMADKNATIISLDLPGGAFGGGYSLEDEKLFRTFATDKKQLHFLRKDSHLESTKKELRMYLGKKKIDLLFIDGDHTYEGVKKDWLMYSPFVRDGGIIVFHDICFHPNVPECQVEQFWKTIKSSYKITEFIDSNDTTWGGIGVIIFKGKGKCNG